MTGLRELLRTLAVRGSVYFCDTLNAPWQRSFLDDSRASFHVVRRGSCRLNWKRGSENLAKGDFVLVKAGTPHSLTSAGVEAPVIESTTMLCGYCSIHWAPAAAVVDFLPPIVILRATEIASMPWFASTLDQLGDACTRSGDRSEVVVDRLTEVLIIELISMQATKLMSEGYALALSDARVVRALQLIHSQPEFPWTIEQLAHRVALSRAALAKRFKNALGLTVIQYLTRIRMHHAELLLRSSGRSLSSIAHQIGYGSDIAFSKAFKREIGITPGRFRKQLSAAAPN